MKKIWKFKEAVPWHIPEKLKRVMRLTVILTLVINVSVFATGNAQHQRVSLDIRGASVEQIFDALSQQTELQFFYNHEQLAGRRHTDVSYKDMEIEKVLLDLGEKLVFSYRFVDNYVVITPRRQTPTERATTQTPQSITITGKVVDHTGGPVAGATVVVKGTATGAATDVNGEFSFRHNPQGGSIILTVSYLGYKTQEVTYTPGTPVRVTLRESVAEVDQVVVTGIFNKPRESYVGAVTTITARELEAYRGQNLIQTLSNIDPSINLRENNRMGSDPNTLPDITIRGSSSLPMNVSDLNQGIKYAYNTPLIIMDGFEISLQKLMDYNDEEIQSINILKDASATAIYGSRGANGVIVIISKEPASGRLKLNVRVGIDVEMPDLSSYNLMNAAEKLKLELDNGFYDSDNPSTDMRLKEVYNMRYRDVLEGTDTYWLSKPLQVGITQRYNIRLEGGSREFLWGVTTGYNRLDGVMKNSYRDNFNGQIMLQYHYKNFTIRNQSEVGINKGVNSNFGSFSDYARMNPYHKLYDNNGMPVEQFIGMNGNPDPNLGNPLYNASLNRIDENAYTQIINNFSVEWNIAESLMLRGRFGVSKQMDTGDRFIPPKDTRFADVDPLEKGSYTYNTGQSNNIDGSMTLGYSRTFAAKHQLYAGLDLSIRQRRSYSYTFEAVGFINDKLNSIGSALNYPKDKKPSESESLTRSIGFTGNINYTFDNRYYFDASLRVDGSSQFGSNNRFAPFWSAGLGWNLHREEFLKNSEVVDNLRLKVSYGSNGSLQFEAYQAMRMFFYDKNDRYGAWSSAYLMGLGNPDLKWQITDQFNIGTEIGIFNNKITASFDYYVKKTSNLLSRIDIPLSTGFNSYTANIGEVKNNGFEASLGCFLVRDTERNISWMVNGKLAYNKNRITKLSDDIKRQSDEYMLNNIDMSTLFYEGYADNSLFVVRSLGIDPSTGQEVFLDKYGNVVNEWQPSDKVYAGVQGPTYRGNASTMFRYRNLTLNLSFAYHWGGVTYNSTLVDKVEIMRSDILYQNVDRRVLTERWNKPGDIAEFKKIPSADESDIATRGTTRFVMDDRVFQLQSASLEYRLETDWLTKAGVQNARIGVNMSDLFYISTVKRERGLSYPFARRVGLNLSFIF